MHRTDRRVARPLAAGLVAAICACVSAALAQNTQAPADQRMRQGVSDTPPPDPDKSGYTLFNPTPDAALRPFATDRPGKAFGPGTVDAGHVQIESDIYNYAFDHWSTDQTTTRQTVWAGPDLRIGLTNEAEFDVITQLHVDQTVRSRAGGGTQRSAGPGDTLLGGKVNLFGNDSGDRALGVVGFVRVPTAAPGLGYDMAEFLFAVPYVVALPAQVSLEVEPGANLLRNLTKQGYQGDYTLILNLSRPVIGNDVTAAMELALDFPTDHAIGPRHTLDFGVQWLLTPALQVDAGVYLGLTRAATDLNPFVGVSYRF